MSTIIPRSRWSYVVLDCVLEHAVVHELADRVLDQALLVAELEVHRGLSLRPAFDRVDKEGTID